MISGEKHPFDTIQACGDYTIVERLDEASSATAAGVIIPDMAQKAPPYWVVVSVGPEAKSAKKGERVLFVGGARVEHDGRTIVAVRPNEIVGTLELPKSHRSASLDPTRF